MDTNNDEKYDTLVLSGGGPRGLFALGALQYLFEKGVLKNIKEYWGTSVGSMICFLLVIGYSPFDIFHKFFVLENFIDYDLGNSKNVLKNMALVPIESLGNRLRQFMWHKLGNIKDLTFNDIYYRFRKSLCVIGTNLDTGKAEIFSISEHGHTSVIDALEISCGLPFIFSRKEYNGQYYIDGGLSNNFAVDLADDGVHRVLGVYTKGYEEATNYVNWVYRIIQIPITTIVNNNVAKASNKCHCIPIKCDNCSSFEMSPSREKKVVMYSSGNKQMRDYWEEHTIRRMTFRKQLAYSSDETTKSKTKARKVGKVGKEQEADATVTKTTEATAKKLEVAAEKWDFDWGNDYEWDE